MRKIILGSLIFILFTSGCSMPFPIPNPFAQEGPEVKELPPDILSIQNINIIPEPPVRPEDQFSIYFEVKSQEEIEPIFNVDYELFDWGLCDWTGGDPPSKSGTWDSFSPRETKLVEWAFEAPTLDQIAHLSVTCPIKFKINYDYEAKSQIDVVVIGETRLGNLQKSGNFTPHVPTLSVGRGPIKIYFDFGNTLPIKEGNELSVYLKVKDKGTGLLGEIGANDFSLEAPDFTVSDHNDYFNCPTAHRCINNQKIPLIGKETFEMRFVFDTEDIDDNIEKTYYLTAKLNYTYPVIGEAKVKVEPR